MNKNTISFETSSWTGEVSGNPIKAIGAFFAYADLDYYKQNLTKAVVYSYKSEVYEANNPSNAFVFYTAMNNFLKLCYCLQEKSKKWQVMASLHNETVFHLSSLTKEEYEDPFIVFQKAFGEKTPEEFESFLCLILELSTSPNAQDPYSDLTIPYIYLIKMLDAVALMKERGIEKIRKNETA